MKRKFLEDMGLTKEQIDQILDENSQDIGKAKGDTNDTQSKLAAAESEIATLKGQLADRDTQLETLKNSTGDIDGLKQQIAALQADNKAKDNAHSAEIKQLKISAAVDAALTAAKAKNLKAVKALLELDADKLEVGEDGSIIGIDEQIKKLQDAEDSKFLFDSEAKKFSVKGAKPGETGREEADSKVDASKMSYEELAAFMEQNPDADI